MHAEGNDLWARFPFMSAKELEAELTAPEYLMGRWELRGKEETYNEVFFDDMTVFRTSSENRFSIVERGKWSAEHHLLTIAWNNGDKEEWKVSLSPTNQTVKHIGSDGISVLKAKRIEAPNVNSKYFFRGQTNSKQSKLIKIR